MIYYSSDNLKIVYCIRNPFYALFKNKKLFTLRANKFIKSINDIKYTTNEKN